MTGVDPPVGAVDNRQLLAHTAGLSDTWYRGYAADRAPSLLQVLQGSGTTTTPPVRPTVLPGSRFRYSGSHYSVLQQLMVDATGTPFEDLLRTLVLDPLAMADSSFDQQFPHQRPDQVAHGHHGGGTRIPDGWRTKRRASAFRTHRVERRLHLLLLRVARQRRRRRGDDQLRGWLGAAGQRPRRRGPSVRHHEDHPPRRLPT
ncbi:serine hydrolase [Micromonospora hortensis]|uniref:serine hydrolase n=1 Tax=Micromonospora hortensis TaxID=2911209 RepID=UPI001EE87A40|nr:serine hydrolase domain-containing protein [Micromonospora hortensis]MCG5452230.1 beta-lactamase family protein [Micromonospora hortensis]